MLIGGITKHLHQSFLKCLCWLLLAVTSFSVSAQPVFEIPDPFPEDSIIFFGEYTEVYIDSTRKLTFEEVRNKTFEKFDKEKHGWADSKKWRNPHWVRFRMSSQKQVAGELLVKMAYGYKFLFYEIRGEEIFMRRGGKLESGFNLPEKHEKVNFPVFFTQPDTQEYLVKCWGIGPNFTGLNPDIKLEKTLLKTHQEWLYNGRHEYRFVWAVIVIGGFLGLFFLVQFFRNKDRSALYYALYLFIFTAFELRLFESHTSSFIFFEYFPVLYFLVHGGFNTIIYFFYLKFLEHIMDSWENDAFSLKVFRFLYALTLSFYGLYVLTGIIYYGFNIYFPLGESWFALLFLVLALPVFYLLYRIYLVKTVVSKFVFTGSTIFILGGFVWTMFSLVYRGGHWHIILGIAYLFEILFFSMAIGQKTRLKDLARISAQEELLKKEKENLELQRQLNEELELRVQKRTAEVVEKNKEISRQKAEQLAAEFNQKLAEAEFKALKAQMNPHFIFNCLNSIKNLIQEEDQKKPIHYLTQFSKLIRSVLNHSENKQITLEEELEMCRLYLEMEKLRFQNGFNFEINIAPNADMDFVKVPPMILQPFLENAIWHGLLHKEGERLLKLEISQNNEAIKCVVEDNGIGREKAAAIKSKSIVTYKSFGTRLIYDRLKINKELFKSDFDLNIIDKVLDKKAAGTRIELSFQL